MAQSNLRNVNVPVTAHINGMFPGRCITVNGTVRPNAQRFSVNLLTSPTYGSANYVFHFNPRFNEGVVVRNTKVDGKWQSEEREGPKFRFRKGQPFEITIRCKKEAFKVLVNGKKFCNFSHRIPMHKAAFLYIDGNVSIQNVTFQQENRISDPVVQYKQPAIDQEIKIPFHNIRGHSVRIIGKPTEEERFAINFMTGDGDIAFHINPRFSEEAIVRNSKIDGEWGSEMRDLIDGFPFARNSPFLINIDVTGKGFEVTMNGVHQFDYHHRVRPIKKIKALQIAQGGAKIHEILFC